MSKENNLRNKNILQIAPALDSGGRERGTVDVAKALKERGANPFIIASGGKLTTSEQDGITFIKYNVSTRNPLKVFSNISFIKKIIKDNNIDLVHVRSRSPAWSAYFAAKHCKIPFVTSFHGIYKMQNLVRKKYNSILTLGDIVIAVSDYVKNHIIKNYRVPENKIRAIYKGVDLEYFKHENCDPKQLEKFKEKYRVPDSAVLITMPARMTNWKGQEFLIKALTKIKNENFYCVLVGDLSKRPKFVKKIHELILKNKLQSKIQIFGPENDMRGLYYKSDIILSTSIEPEAFPKTIIEASAMQKLVLATKLGGSLEVINDNVSGFFCNSRDENQLAEKLKHLIKINSTDEGKQIRKQARLNIEKNFDLKKMQDLTLQVYSELI